MDAGRDGAARDLYKEGQKSTGPRARSRRAILLAFATRLIFGGPNAGELLKSFGGQEILTLGRLSTFANGWCYGRG